MDSRKVFAVLLVLIGLSSSSLSSDFDYEDIEPAYFEVDRLIAGGTQPGRNDFLYKSALYLYSTAPSGINFCSGSILSEHFILTAAHCFTNVTSGTVLAGIHDLQNEDPPYEWDFDRRHVIIHENYIESNFLNDIALINVTANPIVFSTRIQKVKIAPAGMKVNDFFGSTVRIAGWGSTSDRNQEMSQVLLFFNPSILDTDTCRKVYGSIKVTNNSVCIDASDGRSTCSGDSGGGLEVVSANEKMIIGVVSFGLKDGCQKKSPTVATFLSSFNNWISTRVGRKID